MNYIDALADRIWQLAEPKAVRMSNGDLPLYRLYAVLARAKGTATTPEDVHDAWSAWMSGLVANHRSLVPFSDLEPHVQHLDDLYVAAIHAAAREGGGTP